MKKIIFYIPALLHAFIYIQLAMLTGLDTIHTDVWVVLEMLLISGFLLSKEQFYGGLFGILVGIRLIHMSTIDTGQIIYIELPIGVVIITFYTVCSAFVLYSRIKVKRCSKNITI